jgi:hypothetical protein
MNILLNTYGTRIFLISSFQDTIREEGSKVYCVSVATASRMGHTLKHLEHREGFLVWHLKIRELAKEIYMTSYKANIHKLLYPQKPDL